MSSTQLQDELDRSFGDGPAQPSVGTHVEAGRRALRRRRSATVALGAVLVLGVGWAVTGPGGSGPDTGEQIATDPSSAEAPPTVPPLPDSAWEDGVAVRYRDGEVELRPGTVVHQRIDNPYGYAPPRDSVAFDLTFEGQRSWNLLELSRHRESYSGTVPNNGWASFADWVADQTDLTTGGDDGWPDTLRLTDQGELVATPGAEILQRTDDPQLGATFAAPGEPTGAAVVRAEDGQSYFVVWRVVEGTLDVITTPPGDVPGATFEELLTYARGKYASGEGLR